MNAFNWVKVLKSSGCNQNGIDQKTVLLNEYVNLRIKLMSWVACVEQYVFKILSLLTLWTSEAGIPTLRKLPTAPEVGILSARYVNARARSLYTDGTVYQRQAPEVGIQTVFANEYWHRNA